MENYKTVGGYMVQFPYEKENVLDVLINVMSSKGMLVEYSLLKNKTVEELLNKLENLNKNYTHIVTEYTLDGQAIFHKATKKENCLELENGYKFIIETKEEFVETCNERLLEGNELSPREERILNEINREG